ncbi:MAG: IclR family transcriptional regulator [Azospirillaceae bacterium]|nr:IclR family transcriptional regulator [Azospirillaceae bacterium]
MPDSDSSKRTRGLDRAFDILDYLKDQKQPLRPNEIAVGIGAPRSTVYEIINLLLERQILEYFDKDGRVFLGRQLYFLGISHLRHFDLTHEADALLNEISHETLETSQLCMLAGNKYTVVLMRDGQRHFRISSDVGERIPIPWTASGRLLVGHMTDQEIADFIPEADFVLPNGERLALETFIGQIRQSRERGFFTFDSATDTFTHCFAAPVYDAQKVCVATLCIVAPREDAKLHHSRYRDVLIDCANRLAQKITGQRPPERLRQA